MREIPEELLAGPFHLGRARELGLPRGVLFGSRFVRVFPRVYRHRDHAMTEDDWVRAATLTLPSHAHLTGVTRIQQLGLACGPRRPLRFVVEGELHLAPPEIFLHRTRLLPPIDGVGVTPAAAFLAYCASARTIDAIKVGDWLLHHAHMTLDELTTLALAHPWRDGAQETLWVLEYLDGRARSLKESETRAVLVFAGLSEIEVNAALRVGDNVELTPDLLLRAWLVAVEYEGSQHQTDRDQYVSDIDRYALYRRAEVRYVLATQEKLSRPRKLVREVHGELVAAGYDGPPPAFDERWHQLFMRLSSLVSPRHEGARGAVSWSSSRTARP